MISEEEIIKTIADLNFWGKEQKTGIFRETYFDYISKFLHNEDALFIIGVRRAGKTYLTKQILKKLLKKIKPEQTLYINFEDHKLGPYLSLELLDKIYYSYQKIINKTGDFTYLVLDEIQAIPCWEKWVRGKQERKENIKIIVTGSNAKLLKKEISSVLTGRTISFDVFPLSFKEFLMFRGVKINKIYEILTKEKEIRDGLLDYLKFGGFPKVVLEPDEEVKLQTLKELFEGIVNRDIILRNKIREEYTAKTAAELVMSNFSSLLSANKLKNILTDITKTKVSPNFAVKLLAYFEDAFLSFQIPIFSHKIKEQKQYPKKTYSIDSGLVNAVTIRFSENYGRVYENLVAIDLLRKKNKNNIFYWKNSQGYEVDFVVKEGLEIKQLINVCYSLEKKETKKREIRGLIKAMEEFNLKEGLIITENYSGEEEVKGKKIKFIPLWRWLLE